MSSNYQDIVPRLIWTNMDKYGQIWTNTDKYGYLDEDMNTYWV